MKHLVGSLVTAVVFAACSAALPPPLDPELELILRGRDLFLTETFAGNGRTCGSCHPPDNNFAIDQAFVATLPATDPLFVAERDPNLSKNFENPTLMRNLGLILENQDGFDDLENNFNMRGVPHTLGLRTSIASSEGPRTGWSGDGSPGDGSLRSFAVGAVIQHFTKSLNRIPEVDFRLPTDEELDAMEAFQLSLGRQEEVQLPLPLRHVVALRGQEIFNDATSGKCFACHFNAGANAAPDIFGAEAGNLNFNTGVEDLPDQPADLFGEKNPPDDGFGTPGNGNFNTPSLVEAADTGPFFHNNSVETIEAAVAFYNGDAFNDSPAGQLIEGATGSGINLDATQVVAVAAFLRVINSLDNIREIETNLEMSRELTLHKLDVLGFLGQSRADTEDAAQVLAGGGLHPEAIRELNRAHAFIEAAIVSEKHREARILDAIAALGKARAQVLDETAMLQRSQK